MKNVLFLVTLLLVSASAMSDVNIVATQQGGDVVLTGSGTVDLAGFGVSENSGGALNRNQFNLFGGRIGNSDLYSDISIPTFIPLGDDFSFAVGGDNFSLQGLNGGGSVGFLGIAVGYTSGSPINFVWTVSGTTIAALNMNFGTVAEFGNNTLILERGTDPAIPQATAVPALSVWGLGLLAGLIGFLGVRGRKKQLSAR